MRQSDNKWTWALVYYIMVPTLYTSVALMIHVLDIMGVNFGNYLGFFELTGELVHFSGRVAADAEADRAVPRSMPLIFGISRAPVAAFFSLRAYRLNHRPLWFACVIPPLL